ncbi:MAG: glycoside hydrolase family 57 protein [Candidatus Omnitrophica bacterium]|nr:glycoside hydrolase family 57 protein [Candidatus Omnitrophota bacterium]
MLNLAFIYHMHQPYYVNLLSRETELPWVRLHGIKDYLDMVQILAKYPRVRQTFNFVPSLLEQVESFVDSSVKDKFIDMTMRPAESLTDGEKNFLLENFFMINAENCIAGHPRYYELFLKKQGGRHFSVTDYRDLQMWFNLAWFDPTFLQERPALKALIKKGRHFGEEDKKVMLEQQTLILAEIIPAYRKFSESGQVEVILSPYYHPILPLLYNTNIAREANHKVSLPARAFSYPGDAERQVAEAVLFYTRRFGRPPAGMWPSEEAVCDHILPILINNGIKWIVSDEAMLFRSFGRKKRDTALLYRMHTAEREEGSIHMTFRDRNLSDLIGFTYHKWDPKDAVSDFMRHLENTAEAFKDRDILVTIAMDGENAWEYYKKDGHPFLNLLYERLSDSKMIRTVTVEDYLRQNTPESKIRRLAAGSWIYGEFAKWIGNPYKNKAWEYLAEARKEMETFLSSGAADEKTREAAWKQMMICEGSDWFWWYGDYQHDFDRLYRLHLSNFYVIIGKQPPGYLKHSLYANPG